MEYVVGFVVDGYFEQSIQADSLADLETKIGTLVHVGLETPDGYFEGTFRPDMIQPIQEKEENGKQS